MRCVQNLPAPVAARAWGTVAMRLCVSCGSVLRSNAYSPPRERSTQYFHSFPGCRVSSSRRSAFLKVHDGVLERVLQRSPSPGRRLRYRQLSEDGGCDVDLQRQGEALMARAVRSHRRERQREFSAAPRGRCSRARYPVLAQRLAVIAVIRTSAWRRYPSGAADDQGLNDTVRCHDTIVVEVRGAGHGLIRSAVITTRPEQ